MVVKLRQCSVKVTPPCDIASLHIHGHLKAYFRIKNQVRVYHLREDGMKTSIPRITVWHQEACRVMANGDPEVFSI